MEELSSEPQRLRLSRHAKSLMLAAAAGDVGRVRKLLQRGANIQARDVDGWTALMLAAMEGHAAVARILVEEGADPQATDRFGVSVLDCARRSGREEIIRLLKRKS